VYHSRESNNESSLGYQRTDKFYEIIYDLMKNISEAYYCGDIPKTYLLLKTLYFNVGFIIDPDLSLYKELQQIGSTLSNDSYKPQGMSAKGRVNISFSTNQIESFWIKFYREIQRHHLIYKPTINIDPSKSIMDE
jgi:hypothetical protein